MNLLVCNYVWLSVIKIVLKRYVKTDIAEYVYRSLQKTTAYGKYSILYFF